jgi:hypothetical protein
MTVEQTTAATTAIVATAAIASRATTVTTTVTTIAAVAAVASHDSVALTAQQSDADHREEDRDAKNENTIHPKFLH